MAYRSTRRTARGPATETATSALWLCVHDHCVGAYEADGYRFGDYLVGSVYSTADSSSVSPPAPSPPLDVGGDTWYSPVRGQQLGSWTPGTDWTLSFDLFPRGTTAPWASILHVGSENGLRLPGIWFWPNTYRLSRMLVCLGCWFVSDALGCSDSIRVHEHFPAGGARANCRTSALVEGWRRVLACGLVRFSRSHEEVEWSWCGTSASGERRGA